MPPGDSGAWDPASLGKLLEGAAQRILVSISFFHRRKKNVLFSPALFLSWTPLGFAYSRRSNLPDLPEGSRNLQLTVCSQAKEFLIWVSVFLGLLGGRAGCSCAATCWSYPGLQYSQCFMHPRLGAQWPKGSQVEGAGAQGKDAGSLRL